MARLALLGAFVLLFQAGPDQHQRSETTSQQPVFRSGVEFVTLDVVVTDGHDRAVTDLKASDFEIQERGRKQPILDFDRVSIPLADRPIDFLAPAPPRPDVASNMPLPHVSRAFVFVIDDGAVRAADIVPLKRAMTQFLESLSPDDRAAVVYIKRSDLGQDFTNDVGLLIRAVNHINSAVGWTPDARATQHVLENVIATLATAPETRHAVVYVSSGFRVDWTNHAPTRDNYWSVDDLRALFDQAKRADVPIYALDPHGLASPESVNGIGGHLEDQTPENRATQVQDIQSTQDFMWVLAGQTGGLAFVNQSSVSYVVNSVFADNGSYYVLGYSPSPYDADGRFHPVEVRVVTRPGLRVRAKQGYVARKPEIVTTPREQVARALTDGQPGGPLQLRAFAAPVAVASHGATAVVTLDIGYPQVPVDDQRADDDLEIQFLALDSDARVVASERRTFHVPLAGRSGGAFVLSLDDALVLPKGQWTLRVGASSRSQGALGTVHLPVDIPALSATAFSASPLVLSVGAREGGLVAHAEAIADLIPFQPTTLRTFSRDQQLRVFSRVFATSIAQVSTQLRVISESGVSRSIPVEVKATPNVENAWDCSGVVALADLAPGTYTVEFQAQPSRGKPAMRSSSIRVEQSR